MLYAMWDRPRLVFWEVRGRCDPPGHGGLVAIIVRNDRNGPALELTHYDFSLLARGLGSRVAIGELITRATMSTCSPKRGWTRSVWISAPQASRKLSGAWPWDLDWRCRGSMTFGRPVASRRVSTHV